MVMTEPVPFLLQFHRCERLSLNLGSRIHCLVIIIIYAVFRIY